MQNTHIMPIMLVALVLACGTQSAHTAAGAPFETLETLEIHGTGTRISHLNAADENRLIAALKHRHTHPHAAKDEIMALFDVRYQGDHSPSQSGHFTLDEPTVEKALSTLAPGQDITWDLAITFLQLIGVQGITSGALAAEQQAYDAAQAEGRRFQSALDGPLTAEDAALKNEFMAI